MGESSRCNCSCSNLLNHSLKKSCACSSKRNYREGDLVQFDTDIEPEHGKYVIAILAGANEAIFRQYVVDGGIKYLKPLNPQYPLIQIDDETRICGVMAYYIGS
jgi:SOS-response transcriptional repressor LexA